MGTHSNYLTLEGDLITAIAFFALIVITVLIMAIIKKYNNAIKQRNNQQAEQRKRAADRQKTARQKTLDNFLRNRIEEDMSKIIYNPSELDETAQNLVDAYRS